MISFTGDNEHSLYFRSSYIADCEPYLSPSAHVLGAKLEYDSRALSLKRLRQSYPEGNGNGYCRGMTCNAYEKLGFRWQEQAIGEMEVIRKNSPIVIMWMGKNYRLVVFMHPGIHL